MEDATVEAILNAVLKPLGTNTRHYMPVHRADAIEAMRSALLQVRNEAIAEEREAAAKACEKQTQIFLSPEYATGQPLSSLSERFACEACAAAIRARP